MENSSAGSHGGKRPVSENLGSENLGSEKSKFSYYILYSITGAAAIGYGFVITLFAELKENFGFSDTELGLIAAIGFISGFLSQIGLARYADRGYSALMVKTGMAISVGASLWMSFADKFWQFFAARFFLGMAAALIAPAIRRIVIFRSSEKVGANLGFLASIELAGFTMGPVLSAFLADRFGLRVPFITLASIYCLFFVMANFVELKSEAAVAQSSKRALRQLMKIPGIQSGVLMTIALFATIGAFEVSWPLYLDEVGAQTWQIGVGISLFGLPLVFLAPFGGRLAQRLGSIRVMTYSVMGAAVCTLIYGFTPWLWVLLSISLIHGVFDAITYPSTQVGVAIASPPEHTAAGQGLLSAVGLLVAGTIAGIGGVLYDWKGAKLLYIVTVVIMVIAVSLARLVDSRSTTSAQ